jgi:hypothetical protein
MCLETRTRKDGVVRRRYLLTDGRPITTYEIPATVYKGVSAKKMAELIAAFNRGEEKRAKSFELAGRIYDMLSQGIKPAAIAHEVGVSDTYVRQLRAKLRRSATRQQR